MFVGPSRSHLPPALPASTTRRRTLWDAATSGYRATLSSSLTAVAAFGVVAASGLPSSKDAGDADVYVTVRCGTRKGEQRVVGQGAHRRGAIEVCRLHGHARGQLGAEVGGGVWIGRQVGAVSRSLASRPISGPAQTLLRWVVLAGLEASRHAGGRRSRSAGPVGASGRVIWPANTQGVGTNVRVAQSWICGHIGASALGAECGLLGTMVLCSTARQRQLAPRRPLGPGG